MIIDTVLKGIDSVIDKIVPDANVREQIKKDLRSEDNAIRQALIAAKGSIIVAEASGESWLQRSWRPLMMLLFGFVILNNLILVPYIKALFGVHIPLLTSVESIPVQVWEIIKLGIGGYIGGRSAEKITKIIKGK